MDNLLVGDFLYVSGSSGANGHALAVYKHQSGILFFNPGEGLFYISSGNGAEKEALLNAIKEQGSQTVLRKEVSALHGLSHAALLWRLNKGKPLNNRRCPMPDPQVSAALETLLPLMAEQPFLVLTGAGISTSSGIPDYRDSDGVRRGKPPMMIQEFLGSPRPAAAIGPGPCSAGHGCAWSDPTRLTAPWPACRRNSTSAA